MLDGQSAGSLCLAMAIISALKIPKFECICHCAPCYFALVGSETTYNQCYPYMVNKFGKIKIAEPAPVVRSYMPGRLVGDFPEVSPVVSKWLKAAQYYVKVGREKKTALPKAIREV